MINIKLRFNLFIYTFFFLKKSKLKTIKISSLAKFSSQIKIKETNSTLNERNNERYRQINIT